MSFEERGRQVGAIVDNKNKQYGDSTNKTGEMLAILYPDGVKPDQYKDMLLMVRIMDKQNRIANGKQGDEDPWQDLAGYGLLGMGKDED